MSLQMTSPPSPTSSHKTPSLDAHIPRSLASHNSPALKCAYLVTPKPSHRPSLVTTCLFLSRQPYFFTRISLKLSQWNSYPTDLENQMASLQILKSSLTPFSIPYSKDFPGKSFSRKKILRFQSYRSSKYFVNTRFKVCCVGQDDDKQSNGEEPPESLFLKELRRRGMTPTSLLEDTDRSKYGLDEEKNFKEEGRDSSKRNAVSTEYEKNLTKQRELSMALNSEGLEGLLPRAKLLVTIGGTFFFGFWPLILITVAVFSALYFYFGPTFVHDGSRTPLSPPPYVDPYALLEDERISQTAPRVN